MANTGDGNTRNEISGTVQQGPVIQGRDITVTFVRPGPSDPVADDEPWVRLVVRSEAWSRIRPDRDVRVLRERVAAVARVLAGLRDDAEGSLRDDPWLDTQLATRFASRVGWLLKLRLGPDSLLLDPAEAALLAVTPLLQHVLWARSAARLRVVEPTNLARTGSADEHRAAYERYLHDHPRLVDRALLPDLRDRSNALHEIGWWLFHRWTARRAEIVQLDAIEELLAHAGIDGHELRQVMDARRIRELLYGLRLEPQVLCGRDRLNRRPQDTLFAGDPDEEHVRGPLLGLLLGVANATAIPVTDLPDTVAWHLGIPAPVDLGRLRDTIADARWETHVDGLWLAAECQHEAVVEALREQVTRVDTLLRAVRRAAEDHRGLEVLSQLPARASAEQVGPALDTDGKPVFSGWSRFRLDEQRVRELLMGEQLYRDRDLAIRELYQNALDACRYRQAREQFLDRTTSRMSDWAGLIEFDQGTDADGRAYLECVDNGIGMGESELTGVFSEAGARFADLAEFRDEQAEWNRLDPPVELYPNSRFGIGVLSYFMLADEITITTCRMARDGGRTGPVLAAVISGPGHLFQIKHVADHGEPGTRVRLYLRGPLSSVQALRRLLAIADFTTVARHGLEHQRWEPRVLRARQRPSWELEGFNAYGEFISTVDGQVIWCERGGALLVDGLAVRPAQRHGVFAFPGDVGPEGMVVNLTGKLSPRLSVDRTEILDDVSVDVERLVVAGAEELTGSREALPFPEWIGRVVEINPRLADIVTVGMLDNRLESAGYFTQDLQVTADVIVERLLPESMSRLSEQPMDHVLLWRLLARRPSPALDALSAVVPELADVESVAPALPSDLFLLTSLLGIREWTSDRLTPERILSIASDTGATPHEVALRARALNLDVGDPERFSRNRKPDSIDRALVSYGVVHADGRVDQPEIVPVGQFIRAQFSLGITVAEAADRLARLGFDTRETHRISQRPDEIDFRLLSERLTGSPLWLNVEQPVPPWHIAWAASQLGASAGEIADRYTGYGFQVGGLSEPLDQLDMLLLSKALDGEPRWLDPASPVAPGHVLRAVTGFGISASEAVGRLVARGFRWTARVPDQVAPDDVYLLSRDVDGLYPWLRPDELVEPHRFVRIYRQRSAPTRAVADRLMAYGLQVSTGDLPEHPSQADVLVLTSEVEGTSWIDEQEQVPLAHLVRAGRRLSIGVEAVARRLRELGLDAPDPATAVRAALLRVPGLSA